MLNKGYSSSELKMAEMEVIDPFKKESISNSCKLCIAFTFLLALVGACLIVWFVATGESKKIAEVKFEKWKEEWKQEQSATTSPTSSLSPTSLLSTTTQPVCTELWCKIRLPDSIIPYHYNLKIETYPPSSGYNGVQLAFLNITEPIDVILFHIKLIEVTNVSIYEVDSVTPLVIMKHFAFPQNEYYVVQFKSKIPAGNYQLEIHFSSNISDTLTGFYRSSYAEKDDKRVLFTTKFQPTDARKAFPCLDEPNLKATFNIEIIHPQNYHARSNMPGHSVILENNLTSTKFNKTVRMSTYLVCFVVSQFNMIYSGKAGKANTYEISVWSRPEYVNSTEYAFKTSVSMMNFLEEFLNVSYPMPKLDMFGIPDYASGATEHWGIITYRESRLLYTPGVSSMGNMKSTAGIIGHECAHLWFGNLVTCAWWNDLWIQEGLASYMEYYTLNSSHPEWNVFDEFLTSDWLTGITLDALASSHPISQNVDHPSQIKEIFDSITYNKGSSLFHMLDFYLDTDHKLFRAGLEKYLLKYQYKGATTNDLWVEFSQVTGWNVSEMMDTWTQQMGFPVITIKKTSIDTFSIEQSHFLVDPMAKVTVQSKFKYQWIVPFTYATSDSLTTPKKVLFSKKSDTINSNANWMMGNFEHRGFYRVNYDSTGWNYIIDQLSKDFKVFSVTDRAGIIDDAFNLARSGRLGYSTVFSLLTFIDKDDNSFVWEMVLNNLKYLGKVLSSTTVYSHYRAFIARKIKPMVNKKFSTYVSAACEAGEAETIERVKKIFQDWMKNNTIISADIRSAVLKYGIENGGDAEWDFVFEKYMNASDPSDRSRFQSALAASQKPWLLKKWLDYSIDGKTVRTQDTVYVISNVASNPVGKYVAWTFAEANWKRIIAIAKENNFHVNQFITGLTALMSTQYELQKVEELWAIHADERDGVNARQQSLEKIQSDVYWLNTNYKEVSEWFYNNAMI